MKCAKCGLDLPRGTHSCPKCGMVNEFVSPVQPRKIKPVVYAIAALGLIALIAIVAVFAMRGNESVTSVPPGQPSTGGLTNVGPGQPSGGGIMGVPSGGPGAGSTTPPGSAKPKPPRAVVDYLEFVKGVEAHRQKLLKDSTDALTLAASGGGSDSLMKMIDMAMDPEGDEAIDPLAETKTELNRQYKNWISTLQYFDQKPAPPECREFSGAYRAVLYSESKAIGDIAAGFNSVNVMDPKDMKGLLSVLQKMKRDPSIQGGIDQSTDNADAKLGALVANYDMPKPFNVPREQKSGGNIMGF